MASRIIHYTIASELLKRINISNANRFLLGSVIPDASNNKSKSHFQSYHPSLNTRVFNYNSLRYMYIENKIDDFFLGYITHLICDNIYLTDIQSKILYIHNDESKRKQIIRNIYEDNLKLNSMLIDQFKLKYDIKPINNIFMNELDLSQENQNLFLEVFSKDFIPIKCNMDSLKTLCLADVESYINKCILICERNINFIMNCKDCDSTSNFMISNLII